MTLEERVALLEERLTRLTEGLLKQAIAERDIALLRAEGINQRFKLLDDILIRIEVLEETVPPPEPV